MLLILHFQFNIGEDRNVAENGILTYGIKATIPAPGNSLVTCSCPAVADRKFEKFSWINCKPNTKDLVLLEKLLTEPFDKGFCYIVSFLVLLQF